jgi:hypothetical protein
LAYLFLETTKLALKGAKQEVLASWLSSLKALGIHPEFVLIDKDQSEINTVGIVWPNAKHCSFSGIHFGQSSNGWQRIRQCSPIIIERL